LIRKQSQDGHAEGRQNLSVAHDNLTTPHPAQFFRSKRHVNTVGADDRKILANGVMRRGDGAGPEPKALDERNGHTRSPAEAIDHCRHRDILARVGVDHPVRHIERFKELTSDEVSLGDADYPYPDLISFLLCRPANNLGGWPFAPRT